MKKGICSYAPIILLSCGLITWLVTFLLDMHYNSIIVWFFCLLIQAVISTLTGIAMKKLYKQVYIDMLTGLYNRKYFSMKLPELKTQTPVSLILVDIDNFKDINDTYGHKAGDHVLKEFAGVLKKITRKSDIVARWGGEEFAVILPKTDIEEAVKIGDRIRMVVERCSFCYEKFICSITVSIGITSAKCHADIDVEEFFNIADKALYKAKIKKNYVVATPFTGSYN